ncbi:MAG: hypothetical protein NTW49_10510 [Bacteroidia bacterium]|nr:hypothetical protein [Bacteroidia bacterium]
MTDNFGTLKEQENDISQRLQQSETGYKDAFPVVNKTEIKELKTKFKEYGKLETVEKKIAMGKIILDRLEIVEKILPELKEINSNIAVLLPDVQTKYKKFYSPLYKAEIVPFLLKFKEYDENGSVTTKVNLGKKVLEKLKYYNENFTRMKDQGDKLSAKFNEFNDLYKSRKDVKNIYKKGKMACNELLSAYNDEINIEKKMLMGEDIEFLLLKLISIAGKDNSVLNNDIKNAETPADVKRKLGL